MYTLWPPSLWISQRLMLDEKVLNTKTAWLTLKHDIDDNSIFERSHCTMRLTLAVIIFDMDLVNRNIVDMMTKMGTMSQENDVSNNGYHNNNNTIETFLTRIMGRQEYQVNSSSCKFKCNLVMIQITNTSDTYNSAGNKDTRIDNAESPIKRDTTEEGEEFGAPAGAAHRRGAGSATSAVSGAKGGRNNGNVSGY